ncbi:sugar phosphate nucleotidyltransferase [Paenibacillus sp. YYML68]|uniref:sugar phosphate nucleotidyltransferase n=1 Tax=Paenibacillus sp. YYML68 TaxID=2909250 RepID=UPI00249202D4|nr:sugar phosphate nucleotidyltransferase [Paenibacillus sp. YYML68]
MNNKRTLIIPMAGKGSRFMKAGFEQPKYMIEVEGRSLFEISLSSIPLDVFHHVVFVGLEEHERTHDISRFIEKNMNKLLGELGVRLNYEIQLIPQITNGQAETVFYARNLVSMNDELAIYNIDTYFHSTRLRDVLLDKSKKLDGVLGATIIADDDDKWSFAQINCMGIITRTAEKDKISNYALNGFYHFSNASDFFSTAEKWIRQNQRVRDEFYVAPLYNDLIQEGKQYVIDLSEIFIPLGTPAELSIGRSLLHDMTDLEKMSRSLN